MCQHQGYVRFDEKKNAMQALSVPTMAHIALMNKSQTIGNQNVVTTPPIEQMEGQAKNTPAMFVIGRHLWVLYETEVCIISLYHSFQNAKVKKIYIRPKK